MTNRTTGIRVLAAALLLMALVGAFSRVSAQDSGMEPTSTIYVGVSCESDDATTISTCTFSPIDAAGGAVYGVSLPLEGSCAAVIAGGDTFEAGSLSVTFGERVSAGGGASYSVETDAGAVTVPGDGIVCGSTATLTDVVEDAIDETLDDTVVDESIVDDANPEGGQFVETPPDDEILEAEENLEEEINEIAPDVVVAVDVTVTVYAYDCPAVPATGVDGCTPSGNVGLAATADGLDEGAATTDPTTGSAQFVVPEGSQLVVSEDLATIPVGYSPYGNGVASVTAEDGGSITFLHLLDPILGRLQIFTGTCPTEQAEDYTAIRVIEPMSVMMAEAPACVAVGGAVVTLSGGSLGDGIQVMTGGDGSWRGFLPAGTYTVTDDSGVAADVTVIVDDVSVVIVVDYYSRPLGVLNVSRYACEDPNPVGISISLHGTEPDAWTADNCSPITGEITIEVSAEVSTASVGTYDIDASGQIDVELEPGSYLVTDVLSGESMIIDLSGGVRIWTLIQDSVTESGGIGEDPDGEVPDGEDPDDPDDGTGANPDGEWTSGGGTDTGGPGADDDTNGGVDAGDTSGWEDYDAEIASVAGLPETGAGPGSMANSALWFVLGLFGGGIMVGAATSRHVKPRRAA